MKNVEIIGYQRANLGKSNAKVLRAKGMVPCVLYGGGRQIHFATPAILFRDIIYTNEACFVNITVEGEEQSYRAILQEAQYHPVSEIILHADFFLLSDHKKVKMNIPVKTKGSAPGLQAGGKLIRKVKYLTIKALPKDMPEFVELDISNLELGKSAKVKELPDGKYEIMNNPMVTLVSVEIPRVLRGKDIEEEEEEVEISDNDK